MIYIFDFYFDFGLALNFKFTIVKMGVFIIYSK